MQSNESYMMNRAIEQTIFLAVGFELIVLALWPQFRAGVPDSILFAALSTILIAAGVRQLSTARSLTEEISQKWQMLLRSADAGFQVVGTRGRTCCGSSAP
jgi:predicted anti-sigma-YlaC factor YlaD